MVGLDPIGPPIWQMNRREVGIRLEGLVEAGFLTDFFVTRLEKSLITPLL